MNKILNVVIENKCYSLARNIESNYDLLVEVLLKYESHETAKDELSRSIDCLNNISQEIEWLISGKVNLICTFFPINLPLYSLIIFGVVPSFMANELVVRPPVLVKTILQEICEILKISEIVDNIKFVDLERNLFNEAFVSVSDVVLFSGRYENAKNVQQFCPDALFIYNGAGINPIVITDTAKLDYCMSKTIEARIFNSGQDCHGPDIIFVHEKIIDNFQHALISEISKIKIGSYQDREVKIGRLIDANLLKVADSFLAKHAKSIIYGGKIDFDNSIIYPTILKEHLYELHEIVSTEFFAPIFYLLVYRHEHELNKYFSLKSYRDFAMYTSIFGDKFKSIEMPNTILLHNKILNDVERGNDPFGGYGPKSNYASYKGVDYCRPILISYEISSYIKNNTKDQVALNYSLVK